MAKHDDSRRAFHPAVSISGWLLFALAVELAAPSQLAGLSLPALLLLVRRNAARQFGRLAWKARWLWLALLLLYAWSVPGTLVLPSEYSPTHEGLLAGELRIGRLLLLLAGLAWLLAEFSARQLAAGIFILAKPLAWLGLDRRALAVRLALTLELVEHQPRNGKWFEQLKRPADQAAGPDEIRLCLPSVGMHDTLLLCAAMATLGAVIS